MPSPFHVRFIDRDLSASEDFGPHRWDMRVSKLKCAMAGVAFIAAMMGSAQAQYRGGQAGYDYYDPYNGGGSYNGGGDPYYAPYGYGGRQPPYNRAYTYGDDRGPAQPLYVDPYENDRGTTRGGGGYDLGQNASRITREEVPNATQQPPGTIVIDTATRHLYLTEPNGQALRYGIGVGRQGFAWKGVAKVQRKAEWPDWIPPADMLKRRPDLPMRMSGGIENPLGARALYLFQGNRDTLFRIHGTNEPDTIGKAVSSGCIRMNNADVIDLYQRVTVGTKVVVL